VVGPRFLVDLEDIGAGGGEDLRRPALHVGEDLQVVRAPELVASSGWQPELVLLVVVEIEERLGVGDHLAVGAEDDEGRVVGLDGLFVAGAHAGDLASPADTAAVLVAELRAEGAGIVALALVHEAGEVGVVEEAFIILERRAFQAMQERLDAAGEVGDEVLAQVARGVGEAFGIEARFGHLHERDGLGAGAADDNRFALHFAFGFGFAVQVFDAGDLVIGVDDDLADDGVGDEFELAGFDIQRINIVRRARRLRLPDPRRSRRRRS